GELLLSQKKEDKEILSDDESDAPSTVPLEDGVSLQYISAYPAVQSMFHSSLVSFSKAHSEVFPSSALSTDAYPFVCTHLPSLNDSASTALRCNPILLQLFPSLYTRASAHIPCTLRIGSAVEIYKDPPSLDSLDKKQEASHHFSPFMNLVDAFCGDPWERDTSSGIDALLLTGEPPLQLDINCLSLERMSEEEIFSAIRAFPGPPVSGFGGSHLDWLLGQQQLDITPRTRGINGTGYCSGNLFIQELQKMRLQQSNYWTESSAHAAAYVQKSSLGYLLQDFDLRREHSASPQIAPRLHLDESLLRGRDASLLSRYLPSGRGGFVNATNERNSLPGSPLVEGRNGKHSGERVSHFLLEDRRNPHSAERGSFPIFTQRGRSWRGRSGRRPSLSGRGGRGKAAPLCSKSLRGAIPCRPTKLPKGRRRRGGRGIKRSVPSLHPMTTRVLPIKVESATTKRTVAPSDPPESSEIIPKKEFPMYRTNFSQEESSGGGGLPTGVYFDASRQLWRCQWRENGRFKTKGFSLAHYDSLVEALRAAINFRCHVGGIDIRNEWFEPSFALQYASKGNPRRRGMHGGLHKRSRTPAERPERQQSCSETVTSQDPPLSINENRTTLQSGGRNSNDASHLRANTVEGDISPLSQGLSSVVRTTGCILDSLDADTARVGALMSEAEEIPTQGSGNSSSPE
ncbi:AP2 domain transcription factor AP2XI-4, partial [Cardiosporidium cionae]